MTPQGPPAQDQPNASDSNPATGSAADAPPPAEAEPAPVAGPAAAPAAAAIPANWPSLATVANLRSAGRAAIGRRGSRRAERVSAAALLALALHAGGFLAWWSGMVPDPFAGATSRDAAPVMFTSLGRRAPQAPEPLGDATPLDLPRPAPEPTPSVNPELELLAAARALPSTASPALPDTTLWIGRVPGFSGQRRSDALHAALLEALESWRPDLVVSAASSRGLPGAVLPIAENGDDSAEESAPGDETTRVAPVPGPGNPSPRYPALARRRGHEGLVVLVASVDASGSVLAVEIAQSSSHTSLDQAAKAAVLTWSFRPATVRGGPVAGEAEVSIRFQLED